MRRLLVRREAVLYRVFAFDFRDHSDGSLYVEAATASGAEGIPGKRLKVSYHATGRINYRGAVETVIYSEPIFALTSAQCLVCLSLSDFSRLPEVSTAAPDDEVFDVTESDRGRANLYVTITPPDAPVPAAPAVCITYPDWFALQVSAGPIPEADIGPEQSRVLVPEGRFCGQVLGQEQALIFFHQKRSGTDGLIVYWDPQNRHFRVILAAPMRIPPTLDVVFGVSGLEAVPLEPIVRNTATAELRFRVRGRAGFLNEPPPISKLTLDAEL